MTGIDIGVILYNCWLKLSRVAAAPLDYLCMDNSTGTAIHVTQFNEIMKRVSSEVMPDPCQASWITSYSFRCFPYTLCAAVETGSEDQTLYGGWPGMPTHKIGQRSEQTQLKGSMPRRYCDRRVEHEEFQKLLHVRMVQLLTNEIAKSQRATVPVTWESLEVAYHSQSGESTIGMKVRNQVKEEISKRRAATSMQPV